MVHWYHYKKKEDHIKVRDSSLALYRRRVGGGGGSFSFLSGKKIEVSSLFSKKSGQKIWCIHEN